MIPLLRSGRGGTRAQARVGEGISVRAVSALTPTLSRKREWETEAA